ncbi:ABC transporter substrate-binding protein [Marinactinospora rubrisoli]|uniref:ABC transporter substrate-binding protein n=1 Tax=Marinactinospora rubrisoli TaxID=2715399 RepID=A0ABW2KH33_9ACTN
MRRRLPAEITGLALSAALLAGCAQGPGDAAGDGVVELTFWAWAPNMERIVDEWNADRPDVQVTVSNLAQGDNLVTKLLTSHKAGFLPDLVQAEYQALPTLVSRGVLADISGHTQGAGDRFPESAWRQATLGTDAVYAIPQDVAPMMMFYRHDLFAELDLVVPRDWDEFADTARQVRERDPGRYLTTFSANDPGWFAGLSQQARASWWSTEGGTWSVGVAGPPTLDVARYWGELVEQDLVDDQPMYTPAWNKALGDGTQLAWLSGVWAPGVLAGTVPQTEGDWRMAPLPQWDPDRPATGNWGGSTTAVTTGSEHAAAAAEFALWLNTDPEAVGLLIQEAGVYPALESAQTGGALTEPPPFMAGQPDFYEEAAGIAATTSPFAFGPNVNVTYATYKAAFTDVINEDADFTDAVRRMHEATLTDMRDTGFEVAG